MLAYSDRVWRTSGMWPRYYRVMGGKVHTSLRCPGLSGRNARVLFDMLRSLSGVVMDDASLCGHCRRSG
jgi:hypothetical protein